MQDIVSWIVTYALSFAILNLVIAAYHRRMFPNESPVLLMRKRMRNAAIFAFVISVLIIFLQYQKLGGF